MVRDIFYLCISIALKSHRKYITINVLEEMLDNNILLEFLLTKNNTLKFLDSFILRLSKTDVQKALHQNTHADI